MDFLPRGFSLSVLAWACFFGRDEKNGHKFQVLRLLLSLLFLLFLLLLFLQLHKSASALHLFCRFTLSALSLSLPPNFDHKRTHRRERRRCKRLRRPAQRGSGDPAAVTKATAALAVAGGCYPWWSRSGRLEWAQPCPLRRPPRTRRRYGRRSLG